MPGRAARARSRGGWPLEEGRREPRGLSQLTGTPRAVRARGGEAREVGCPARARDCDQREARASRGQPRADADALRARAVGIGAEAVAQAKTAQKEMET